MKTFILLPILILALGVWGCKHEHEHEHQERHTHKAESHSHSEDEHTTPSSTHADEIIFTKAQAEKTDFKVEEIQPKTFQQVIKTTGQILPAPGDESVIVATSNGIVSFSNKRLTEGTAVKKGETAFTIMSRNIAEGDAPKRNTNARHPW